MENKIDYSNKKVKQSKKEEIRYTNKADLIETIKMCGWSSGYASAELRNDPEVVMAAIKKNRNSLVYTSEEVKKDIVQDMALNVSGISRFKSNKKRKLTSNEHNDQSLEKVSNI